MAAGGGANPGHSAGGVALDASPQEAQSLIGWAYDSILCGNNHNPVSQRIYACTVRIANAAQLTSCWLPVGAGGATVALAQFAHYDTNGNRLSLTDLTAYMTATGDGKKFALTGGPFAVAPGANIVCALFLQGAALPILRSVNNGNINGAQIGVGANGVTAAMPGRMMVLDGQVGLPANLDWTTFNVTNPQCCPWFGLS